MTSFPSYVEADPAGPAFQQCIVYSTSRPEVPPIYCVMDGCNVLARTAIVTQIPGSGYTFTPYCYHHMVQVRGGLTGGLLEDDQQSSVLYYQALGKRIAKVKLYADGFCLCYDRHGEKIQRLCNTWLLTRTKLIHAGYTGTVEMIWSRNHRETFNATEWRKLER